MIGDALGDLKAARDNAALFFPVVPGREEQSWKRFYEQGSERFFDGTFAGAYQQELLRPIRFGSLTAPPRRFPNGSRPIWERATRSTR